MNDTRPKRRLAAILAADVVGYSRLIRADEDGTLRRLRALRSELVEPKIAEHGGRIVKLMGDGILVEFPSAVAAVAMAVEVQREMPQRDPGAADDQRIELRIGINLGDVVVEGDDIHGDGVNVAARLEALAEPGGICIAGNVHDQVRDRTTHGFEDMGPQTVKNIDRPVHVWRWAEAGAVAPAGPDLTLPEKPSIAVLAFDNMSSDPDQAFFADGIAEDIITALSRVSEFFVTARNSSFTYKGRSVDVQQIGRELGVRYVVEGSVRTAGNRMRVTAQLIDALTGRHVWADKYDRSTEDIFEVQDEITRNVVSCTQIQIRTAEASLFEGIAEQSLPVWGLLSRATRVSIELTRETLHEAIRLAEQALAMDRSSGRAHEFLAFCLWHLAWMGFADDKPAVLARARKLAERAVQLNARDEAAHYIVAMIRMYDREHDSAIASMQRSIEINPNYSRAYGSLATIQNYAGLPEEAIGNNQIALRSNPIDPGNFFRYCGLTISHLLLRQYDEALEYARKTVQMKPDWYLAHAVLIAVLSDMGRDDDCRRAVAAMRVQCPDFSMADVESLPFRRAEDLARIVDPVRRALQETP